MREISGSQIVLSGAHFPGIFYMNWYGNRFKSSLTQLFLLCIFLFEKSTSPNCKISLDLDVTWARCGARNTGSQNGWKSSLGGRLGVVLFSETGENK